MAHHFRPAIPMFRLAIGLATLLSTNLAQADGVAFILNSASSSVSVVDMTARREVRRIPALREPHHIVLSPDGKSLLIGDTAGNQVMFLDPVTGAVQRRVPISDPYHLAFSPNGKLLVVNGLARNQVDVYDAATLALIKRFPVDSTPSHLDFSPDSRFAYVSLQNTGKLAAFDLTTMTPKWTEPVGPTPAGVLWWRDKVMVANMGADYVAIADPATGKVVDRIVTGKGAHTLFLAPDKKILWVNNRASGTTVALDAQTLKIVRVYNIPGGPDDIDFAPDGTLWITRRFAEKVAVLHPDTGAFETISVGRSPHGLWLNPKAPAP